jgi:hypothetical protein
VKLPRFVALLGAVSLSLALTACSSGRLHILIPDFVKNGVDGLRLYRVMDKGMLQLAGRITFGRLRTTANGLEMTYTQVVPGHNSYGPLVARATRPRTGQLQLELPVYNPGAPTRFKFASYNERGTSRVTSDSIYVAGGATPQ